MQVGIDDGREVLMGQVRDPADIAARADMRAMAGRSWSGLRRPAMAVMPIVLRWGRTCVAFAGSRP